MGKEALLWSCSGQTFMGIKTTQYWADLALWEKFLNRHSDIMSIIELGTEKAGLSLFLSLQARQRGIEFRTFDHKDTDNLDTPLAKLIGLRDAFSLGNLFGVAGTRLIELLKTELSHPILLFCDDGDKAREFKEFVPYLRIGDYVGVHDWGKEIFEADVTIFGKAVKHLYWDEWELVGSLTRFMQVVEDICSKQ